MTTLDETICLAHHDGLLEVEPIYLAEGIKECVGFLCEQLEGAESTKPQPKATCFFIRAVGTDETGYMYIVTAKHVVEHLNRDGARNTFLRLHRGSPGEWDQGPYIPLDKKGWVFHSDPRVDLAVYPWVGPAKTGFTVSLLSFEKIMQTPSFQARQVITEGKPLAWPLKEGEDVWFISLMLVFPGEQRNLPVVRRGSITLMPSEPLRGAYGLSDYYVIAVRAYPGHSGSPVWVNYGNTFSLLGVLVYSYPDLKELQKVTETEQGYSNLDLHLVAPIEKVIDIINSDSERKRRGEGREERYYRGI